VFQYLQRDATYYGMEASASAVFARAGGFDFIADGVADYVRAKINDGGGAVPRIPPLRLLGGIGIGTLAWGAQGLGLFFLGQAAGIIWGPGLALGIYAAGLLASLLVFFMPGGLGGTELAMVGLLKLAGTSAAAAVPLTLLSQLVNLWFAVLLGLAAALFLSFRPPLSSPEPLLP